MTNDEDGVEQQGIVEVSRNRSRCILVFAPEFEDAARKAKGLGAKPVLRLVTATTRAGQFFDEWRSRSSASDSDLRRGRWQFKQIKGADARRAKLHQVYLDGARGLHRSALVIDERSDACVMRFLLVYHKREQQLAIERAVAIAERSGEDK